MLHPDVKHRNSEIYVFGYNTNMVDTKEVALKTFNKEPFVNSVDKISIYHGADNFYKNSDLETSSKNGEYVLAACPGGYERSAAFNSLVIDTGIKVPNPTQEGKTDPNSPLERSSNKGLALTGLFRLLAEKETKATSEGLELKYFDKPVKRLVLIAQMENYSELNMIGRFLENQSKIYGKNIPIEVDIVIEYDVRDFIEATKNFVTNHQVVSE